MREGGRVVPGSYFEGKYTRKQCWFGYSMDTWSGASKMYAGKTIPVESHWTVL